MLESHSETTGATFTMEKFNPSEVHRTHDSLYLQVPESAQPKDSFKTSGDLLAQLFDEKLTNKTVLDIGCAVGHFPHYLQTRFPNAIVEGLEYLPDLVEKGSEVFPGLTIRQGSIFDDIEQNTGRFDAITMLGVLQIFDDIWPIVKNIASWVRKPGGVFLVHGLFNRYDYDVFTRYRPAGGNQSDELENGWNIISQKTFTDACISSGAKSVKFHEFHIGVDLEPNPDDPIRSWTEKNARGRREIVNGLHIRQPQFIAEAIF
jgi:SAM-dependent methyltransferase